MQTSDKKREANRQNAKKSTGPRTPTGKQNSSRNARRSRFLASTLLITHESRDQFTNMVHSFHCTWSPQDSVEHVLVEKMAAAHWRLLRTWSVETAALDHETRLQAQGAPDQTPPFHVSKAMYAMSDGHRHADTLGRHSRRYEREFYQAMNALRTYRAEKMHERSHQPDEYKGPAPKNEPTSEATGELSEPTTPAIEPTLGDCGDSRGNS